MNTMIKLSAMISLMISSRHPRKPTRLPICWRRGTSVVRSGRRLLRIAMMSPRVERFATSGTSPTPSPPCRPPEAGDAASGGGSGLGARPAPASSLRLAGGEAVVLRDAADTVLYRLARAHMAGPGHVDRLLLDLLQVLLVDLLDVVL